MTAATIFYVRAYLIGQFILQNTFLHMDEFHQISQKSAKLADFMTTRRSWSMYLISNPIYRSDPPIFLSNYLVVKYLNHVFRLVLIDLTFDKDLGFFCVCKMSICCPSKNREHKIQNIKIKSVIKANFVKFQLKNCETLRWVKQTMFLGTLVKSPFYYFGCNTFWALWNWFKRIFES